MMMMMMMIMMRLEIPISNNLNPDQMTQSVLFYFGLHCLLIPLFVGCKT